MIDRPRTRTLSAPARHARRRRRLAGAGAWLAVALAMLSMPLPAWGQHRTSRVAPLAEDGPGRVYALSLKDEHRDALAAGGEGLALHAYTLLHADRETGVMRQLMTSGRWAYPTRRPAFDELRLVGVRIQGEHLFVCQWHGGSYDFPPHQLLDPKTQLRYGAKVDIVRKHELRQRYRVEAFDIATGESFGGVFVEPPTSALDPAPAESIGDGPLRPVTLEDADAFGVDRDWLDARIVRGRTTVADEADRAARTRRADPFDATPTAPPHATPTARANDPANVVGVRLFDRLLVIRRPAGAANPRLTAVSITPDEPDPAVNNAALDRDRADRLGDIVGGRRD